MKNFAKLTFAASIAMTSMLAGCELYFDGHDDEHWNYCGSDGYYDCYGEDCSWVSPSCPVGGGGGGGGGFACTDDQDCAAGCYCSTGGVCEEAGFCGSDADCGPGYHCNEERASCEPNPPTPTCSSDAQCAAGEICLNGGCTTTCACASDAEAQQGGYGWCDESRNTCMPGSDPAGTCAGDVTCNTAAPSCAEGEVPLILNGCYTGACRAIAVCGETPSCSALDYESDCLNRATDCSAVYTGTGCRKPDGSACQAGDQGCVCQNFNFHSCEDRSMARQVVIDSDGARVDASEMF